MIKAVLFDFDGTLIDTNKLIFESYRKAYREVLNKEMTMEEILFLYGKPLHSSLIEQFGSEIGEKMYSVYRKYNEDNHDILAKGFLGASEGVRTIHKMGLKIGIVTSKRLHMVERGLKIMGLNGIFDVIITPDDTKKTKPDPEPVLCGCTKLGVKPSEAIYVGDSIFDMQSGKSAGTKLCAVKYTITPLERFAEFEPEFLVDSMIELAEILKGQNNVCNN